MSKGKLWRCLLLVTSLAGLLVARAESRPVVAVSFDLAVPRWQSTYYGSKRDELQDKVAEFIASWLGQQMGFVHFDASGAAAPHKLV
ncbi:MAG: hypothetical protein RLZZ373_1201, partial [Pseudomonadota bacterium]